MNGSNVLITIGTQQQFSRNKLYCYVLDVVSKSNEVSTVFFGDISLVTN